MTTIDEWLRVYLDFALVGGEVEENDLVSPSENNLAQKQSNKKAGSFSGKKKASGGRTGSKEGQDSEDEDFEGGQMTQNNPDETSDFKKPPIDNTPQYKTDPSLRTQSTAVTDKSYKDSDTDGKRRRLHFDEENLGEADNSNNDGEFRKKQKPLDDDDNDDNDDDDGSFQPES